MQIGQSLSLSAPQPRREATPPAPVIHLFIVAGQSNAAGRALDDGGAGFPPGTLEYGAENSWVAVSNRLYHGNWEVQATAANFGFARQFAIDYAAGNPGVTLGFIGVAHGGTGFQSGNWRPGDPSYNQAVARVNAAMAVAPERTMLKGILWHQGENDGQTVAAQNAYAGHLTTFIPAFRAAIGAPDLPFVLGGHAYGALHYNHITHRTIQAIPNLINRTGYAPADVPQNASVFDGIHYDAISQRRLGSRFVEALAEAEVNTALGGSGAITTGTATRYNLPAGGSGNLASVNLGAAAPGRLIVVGFQGRNSSFTTYPVAASLGGVPLKRMAAPNTGAGRNCTTFMYAHIPEGTAAALSVIWANPVNAGQAACFTLPVYGARQHLAGTGAFNIIGGGNGYGAAITTSLDVAAGDLILALCGAQQTTAPTGMLDLALSENGALGPNATMVLGHEIATATGSRSVTCGFGGVVINNPTLTVMALRPA